MKLPLQSGMEGLFFGVTWVLCLQVLLIPGQAGPERRVIGGFDTQSGSAPWQLSLRHSGVHICGAVLIENNKAITAAHCVINKQHLSIRAGSLYLHSCTGNCQTRKVLNYCHPPDFVKDGNHPNDIAVLHFIPLDLSEHVRPIAMANSADSFKNSYISGWGAYDPRSSAVSKRLLYARTTIISNIECKIYWKTYILPSHICVMDDDMSTSSCNGDSGGPLWSQVNGKWKVVGVASWGIKGCDPRYPSVYTRVSYYKNWINNNCQ